MSKLYLIPTTAEYSYEPYDHVFIVKAQSDREAYNKAKSQLYANIPQELPEYESYNMETYNLPLSPFPESKKCDILNSILGKTKGLEDNYMDIYDYMYWGDYNARIKELAEKAIPEKWSFSDKEDYIILKNYL